MTDPESSATNMGGSPPSDAGAGPAAAHLILYVDGACSGNPGPCGSAAILKTDDGTTLLEKARAVDAALPPEARKKPQAKTFKLK